MALLAIDTATRQMGVAVVDGERLMSSYEVLADNPHGIELPAAVTRVLKDARTSLEQLEGIIVDIGPGSFTGLRIGLAFVKALAFSTKKPLIGIPSLDVLAANVPFSPRPVCVILDAKQRNVYAARFRLDGTHPMKETDYLLGPTDDIIARVAGKGAIFLGDGIGTYRDRILARCPDAQFAAPELWLPRAATLGRLGAARFQKGEKDDPAALVPMYLYPLDCSVRGPDRPTSVLAAISPSNSS